MWKKSGRCVVEKILKMAIKMRLNNINNLKQKTVNKYKKINRKNGSYGKKVKK